MLRTEADNNALDRLLENHTRDEVTRTHVTYRQGYLMGAAAAVDELSVAK